MNATKGSGRVHFLLRFLDLRWCFCFFLDSCFEWLCLRRRFLDSPGELLLLEELELLSESDDPSRSSCSWRILSWNNKKRKANIHTRKSWLQHITLVDMIGHARFNKTTGRRQDTAWQRYNFVRYLSVTIAVMRSFHRLFPNTQEHQPHALRVHDANERRQMNKYFLN